MMRSCGQYLRISDDPSLERLGVNRQRDETAEKVTTLGWRIVETYEDNDRTASDPSKPRPAFARMLGDIAGGKINAVVVWDQDRLLRLPREGEDFLELVEAHGVALASVGGDVDLATDNGRLFFRIKVAVSRAEMERKSARQKSANRQRAKAGKPPTSGRRPFGYTPGWGELVESEATEIRKAAATVLAGGSIHAIVRDLRARGVKTSAGGTWYPTGVRRLLLSPRNASLRYYHGKPMGDGQWPPILDRDTYAELQAVLNAPGRHKAGPPRRYLGSGIYLCGVRDETGEPCDRRMYGVTEREKGARYRCESRRHLNVLADPIDELVLGAVVYLLTAEPTTIPGSARPDGSIPALREEEGTLRTRLDRLAEAYADGTLDESQLAAGTARVRARLDEVTQKLAEAAESGSAVDAVLSAEDAEATLRGWCRTDIARARAVVDEMVIVRLWSPGKGARRFKPSSVGIGVKQHSRFGSISDATLRRFAAAKLASG